MRTILILNPTSGSSIMATNQNSQETNEEAILNALRAHDIEPEIRYTTPEDTGKELARQAAREGAEMVIAVGGDGTTHAVAGGLIGTKSILGIIPLGTMNNIAHSLEIPEDINEACQIIADGTTSLIDVGKMNDHIFLEVTGIGLEAVLFPAAEEVKRSGLLSTLQGIIHGLKALFAFKPAKFTVSFDGRRSRRFLATQISVCNSPYYGARLRFAPYAVMDDGFLDVLIYKNFSKFEYIRHAISISQGQRALEARVSRRKAKSISIRSEEPAEIHVDGVPTGHTPALIVVQPSALRVRVPHKVAAGPQMTTPAKKQRKINQKAQNNAILEEKGSACQTTSTTQEKQQSPIQ